MNVPQNNTKTPDANPKQPTRPVVAGELQRRLHRYARDKGRSINGAANWAINQFLKSEGY